MLLTGMIVNISCTRVARLSIVISELMPATGVETAFGEPPELSPVWSVFKLLLAGGMGTSFGVPTDPLFTRRLLTAAVRCEYFFFILVAIGAALGLPRELFFS